MQLAFQVGPVYNSPFRWVLYTTRLSGGSCIQLAFQVGPVYSLLFSRKLSRQKTFPFGYKFMCILHDFPTIHSIPANFITRTRYTVPQEIPVGTIS